MNCTYCDTELPVGALFCGECGRAVASETAAKQARAVPSLQQEPAARVEIELPSAPMPEPDSAPGLEPRVEVEPESEPEPEPELPVEPWPEPAATVKPMPERLPASAPVAEFIDLGARCEQCGAIVVRTAKSAGKGADA